MKGGRAATKINDTNRVIVMVGLHRAHYIGSASYNVTSRIYNVYRLLPRMKRAALGNKFGFTFDQLNRRFEFSDRVRLGVNYIVSTRVSFSALLSPTCLITFI